MFKSINLKLGNARKPEEYTIYPYSGKGIFTIQSDKRIAEIKMDGSGIVSNPHPSGAYFHHLVMERNPVTLTDAELMELKLTVLGEGERPEKNGLFTIQNFDSIKL